MEYLKPWLSFEEQADLIIGRGLEADRDELIERLSQVGYYRLSGYWYIFRETAPEGGLLDSFAAGSSFSRVWSLYTFDRQFRLIVLDAIERIEVFLRTRLAYELAAESCPFGFLDPKNLPRFDEETYASFIRRCRKEFQRSREPFAVHFKKTYGDRHDLPPYWILVNTMDFGTMLRLYKGASPHVRHALALSFSVSPRVLESWLMALNTVRNICAHHGRLWNRALGTRPVIPKKERHPLWHEPFEVRSDNMLGILTILSFMLEVAAPTTSWRNRLFGLLSSRQEEELLRMGFRQGWETCPIWSKWLEDSADLTPLLIQPAMAHGA